MDIKLIVGLIAFTGVLASAIIQYYLGRRNELNKKTLEIKSEAYIDFINIVSSISSSNKHDEKRNLEQLTNLTQSKSRIVLIGSNEVVTTLHQFFSKFGVLNSPDAQESFSKIVLAMRSDLAGDKSLDFKVVSETLFG